jgi:hypothetical protein
MAFETIIVMEPGSEWPGPLHRHLRSVTAQAGSGPSRDDGDQFVGTEGLRSVFLKTRCERRRALLLQCHPTDRDGWYLHEPVHRAHLAKQRKAVRRGHHEIADHDGWRPLEDNAHGLCRVAGGSHLGPRLS